MAKQRDDRNPKRKPDDEDPKGSLPNDEVEELEEVEEIVEADIEEPAPPKAKVPPKTKLAGRAPQKTQLSRNSPQPTMLGPQEGDEADVVVPAEGAAQPKDADFAEMPNLSLDDAEPADAPIVEEGEGIEEIDEVHDVLADDPVKVSGTSSVVEIAELVEEVDVLAEEPAEPTGTSSVVEVVELAEDIDEETGDVLNDESVKATGSSVVEVTEWVEDSDGEGVDVIEQKPAKPAGSSIVEVLELAEDIDEESPASDVVLDAEEVVAASMADEPSDVKSAPATPAAPVRQDIFTTDFLESQDDDAHGPSSIFDEEIVPKEKPDYTDSMHRKAEAFDEILDSAAEETGPKNAGAKKVDSDAVDLGSDPEVGMEQPSGFPKIKPGKHKPAEPEETDAAEEVDWDDIGAVEDSKVEKKSGSIDKTIAFQAGPDSGAKKQAADEVDLITEEDLAGDESSAVDLGKKGAGKKPLSGVDPVAEGLESGVNLDDEDKRAPKKKKQRNEAEEMLLEDSTELDVAAVDGAELDNDDDDLDEGHTVLDEDLMEEKSAQSADDAAADIFFEDDKEETAKPKKGDSGADDVQFDDDEEAPRAKKQKATDDDADDLAAAAFLDDDEEPAAKKITETSDEEDDSAAAALLDDEEEPAPKKKKGKKQADEDEEEEELVGAGTDSRGGKTAAKPKYGRRWLGGMVLATLLVGGAGAGIWYAKPDLLEQAYKSSPAYVPPKKEIKVDPPAVRARAQMDNNDFAKALEILETADKSPVNLSTRAEARWLKYLQEQTAAKKSLDKDAPEVTQVLADLKEANNDLLRTQVNKTLDETKLSLDLMAKEKNILDLKDMVEKSELAKKEADKQITGIADALIKEKLLDDKDKLDPVAFEKILKDLGINKTGLAAVNKLLEDAKIKDAGDKGVEKLISAKKDVDEKLEAINKLLGDEKYKGEGVKGLEEVIAARNKLAKDRDELDQAIKGAYKELSAGGLLPPDDDPRAKILVAAKMARLKAESPLAIPLTQLANAMSGLGIGAGKIIENTYDFAAQAAELNFYRLREPFILTPDRKMDSYIVLFQDRRRQDPSELALAAKEAAWLLSTESKSTPEDRAKALYVTALTARNRQNFESARKNLTEALKAGANWKNSGWMKLAAASLKELTEPGAYFLPTAEKFLGDGNLTGARDVVNLGLQALPGNPQLLALRSFIRLESARGNKGKLEVAQKDIRQDAESAAKDTAAAADATYVLGLLEEELGNLDKAEDDYRSAIKVHQGNPDDASRYVIALARLLQRDRPNGAAPAVPMKEEPAEPKAKVDPEPKKADAKKVDDEPKKKDDLKKDDAEPKKAEPKKKDDPDLKKDDAEPKKAEPKKKDEADLKKDDVEPKKAEPKKKDDDLKKDDAEPKKEADPKKDEARLESIKSLVALVLLGVQLPGEDDEENPAAAARIQESIDLAKQLIQSANPKIKGQGYMILGQALSKKGMRTEGMKEYVKGLELLNPSVQSKELGKLVEEHPAFQQPDAAPRPNPVLAEHLFGKGLHSFWARQYPEAEVQFKQAIQLYNQDARYQYFLGMAMLGQKGNVKRDAAYYAFEQGARLEAANRPSMGDVNASLERIQGRLRVFLDVFRQKALTGQGGSSTVQ